MLMYLFWIYIVLKVKMIADYEKGITKKSLLDYLRMKLRQKYVTFFAKFRPSESILEG